jgi:hypothetical protein
MEGEAAVKKSILALFLILLTVSVFSLDFGGSLEDSTIFYYSDSSSFYHADSLALWLKTELWEDTDLLIHGSYTYTTDNPWFFDLNYLKVENKSASLLNYSIGRFTASDYSGYIFNHKLDGASLTVNLPLLALSTNAGYTGFLFDTSSSVEMTIADQSGLSYGKFPQDFAAPRLIGGLQAFFPELFLNQDLRAEVWAQFDIRKEADLTSAKKLDTQYYGLSVSGPLISTLYYDSFAYLETGQAHSGTGDDYSILSYMGSAGLRYYIEDFLYSKISLRFLYSSGDSDFTTAFTEGNTSGDAANFTPISRKTLGLVFSPQLGNVFFTRFSYSLKPFSGIDNRVLQNIQFELTDINFFRSTSGAVSVGGIDPESTSLYLGTELDGTINFRPYSDLGLSLSGGVFIPANGSEEAFLSTRTVEYLGRLGLSFSF